jgi:hypothetical protein
MTDVLAQMRPLSWRGILLPIVERSAGFQHDEVQHKFTYRDEMLIESTGRRNLTFRYTVPMRQDIARGPYANLYTEVLPQLFDACRNRGAGELDDPVYGAFRAKCTAWDDMLDPNKRDGIDVRLEFIHAPAPGETAEEAPRPASPGSLETDAGKLDADVAGTSFEFNTQTADQPIGTPFVPQQNPPEATLDLFTAIAAYGRNLEQYGNRISAQLDRASARLERIEESYDDLGNPKNWAIIRSSRRLRGNVQRVKERLANPARDILRITTSAAIGIGELSGSLGLSVRDLLRLNPKLAKLPLVPKGTTIQVNDQSQG